MKAIISRADGVVTVEGIGVKVELCSHLPDYVQTIHWDDAQMKGFIEFVHDGSGRHMPNVKIAELAPYRYLFEEWIACIKAAREEAATILAHTEAEKQNAEHDLSLVPALDEDEQKDEEKQNANAKLRIGLLTKIRGLSRAIESANGYLVRALDLEKVASEKLAALRFK